jgi:hypothetical protein
VVLKVASFRAQRKKAVRNRGNNGEAVQCYERALALAATNPERLPAPAGLAGCCANTGHRDEAVAVTIARYVRASLSWLGFEPPLSYWETGKSRSR